jgi:Protein of unknown function (DUF4239)
MSSLTIGSIVFACLFVGALLGMFIRTILPAHHLSPESKDVVKVAMGLIGTMGALLLGLLVASAKNTYDTEKTAFTQMSSKIIFLDRVMAHYGPETKESRDLLRRAVVRVLNQIWPQDSSRPAELDPTAAGAEVIIDKMQALAPQNDAQRALKGQALSIIADLGQTRWLMFEQSGGSVSMALVVVVVFWLTILFVSFGLYAPPNTTVIAALFVCALSVSGALFLILELDHPFEGLIQIPSTPLRNALAHLGR